MTERKKWAILVYFYNKKTETFPKEPTSVIRSDCPSYYPGMSVRIISLSVYPLLMEVVVYADHL